MKSPSYIFTSLVFCVCLRASEGELPGAHGDIIAKGLSNPLGSAVDSLLGISTARSTSTEAAASTVVQTPTPTEAQSTTAKTSQPALATVSTTQEITFEVNSSTAALSASGTSNTDASSSSPARTSSSPTIPSSESSSTLTPFPIASTPVNPLQGLPSSSPAASPPDAGAGNHVSTAGIAVAIVLGVIIATGLAYLLLKFNPAVNARYAQWQESRRKVRTYRAGLCSDEENGHQTGSGKETESESDSVATRVLPLKYDHIYRYRDSENTVVSMNSPAYEGAQERRPRPFSFQFFTQSNAAPRRGSQVQPPDIRRKPVVASDAHGYEYSTNKPPGHMSGDLSVGVAVPLGGSEKRLPAIPT